MFFSAYNSEGLRTLSTAHFEAMANVRQAIPRRLSEDETSRISETLARTLMKSHDAGERNPDRLKNAALQQVFLRRTSLGSQQGRRRAT